VVSATKWLVGLVERPAGRIGGGVVSASFGGSALGAGATGAGGAGKVTTTPRDGFRPAGRGRQRDHPPEVSARSAPAPARAAIWPASATAETSRIHFIGAYPKDTGQETSFGLNLGSNLVFSEVRAAGGGSQWGSNPPATQVPHNGFEARAQHRPRMAFQADFTRDASGGDRLTRAEASSLASLSSILASEASSCP